jgi:hypothetical protein
MDYAGHDANSPTPGARYVSTRCVAPVQRHIIADAQPQAGPLQASRPTGLARRPPCRTGLSSCRYTVSVTWLQARPASRAIFSIAMPSSDNSATKACRRSRGAWSRPAPGLSHTSWNILRTFLAASGVLVAVVDPLRVSCQRDPAASRSPPGPPATAGAYRQRSAPAAARGATSANCVFQSPSARSTATAMAATVRSTPDPKRHVAVLGAGRVMPTPTKVLPVPASASPTPAPPTGWRLPPQVRLGSDGRDHLPDTSCRPAGVGA